MAAVRFAIHPDCHRTWRALPFNALSLGLESTIANDDICAFVMAAHRQRSPVMLVAGPVGENQGGEIITGIEGFQPVFLGIPLGFLWDFELSVSRTIPTLSLF